MQRRCSWPSGPLPSKITTVQNMANGRRWIWNGQKMAERKSCLSCKRGLKQSIRKKTETSSKNTNSSKRAKCLYKGKSVGNKIAQGSAHVIKDVKDIAQFKAGEILVTEMTDPDWVPIMRIASAIVTNRGGRTSHAAIVSRELGLPCIVGTNNATQVIETGQKITVSCAEGEKGLSMKACSNTRSKKLMCKRLRSRKRK